MDTNLAQTKMKTALKQLLKKREHTYSDVAKVWGCSLPTVKRQLGNEELPLSRLLSLLEWLDLSLGDLEKMATADSLMRPGFTARQTEFLAKNMREYVFLMKLYDDLTPQQIAKKFKLTSAAIDKILIQLEKYDLIRVGAAGKIKPFYPRMPNIDGALALATIRRQIDCMGQYSKTRIEETISQRQRGLNLNRPPGQYSWSIADVSEKTYRDFLKRIQPVLEDLEKQSKFESNLLKSTDLKKAVISFGAQLEEQDSPHLNIVTEIFDEYLRETN
jgi:hypothetical protein